MKFWNYVIGPTAPDLFAACIFFAAIGILFILLMGTKLREKTSQGSPYKFSWDYLFTDNAKRIYASVIAVLVSLRFTPELFHYDLTPFIAFGIGTFWDGIALFIKQKTKILDPKEK